MGTKQTARDVYDKIRRDCPSVPALLSKVAEVKQSLSGVEQERLLELLLPDLRAWVAIFMSKTDIPVPLTPLTRKKHLRESSRLVAKLVAHDLKGRSDVIAQAAKSSDKQFFIELGKCLSGEIAAEYYDRMDFDIAKIVCANPSVKAGDAIRELQRLGHPCISEDNFRMRKKRLKLTEFARSLTRNQSRKA